jgi:hypothetical protein
LFLISGLTAFATVAPGPTVGGFTSFVDSNTGFEWLTLNNFYNEDYATQLASLPTGFHAATFAEVTALTTGSLGNPTDDPSWVYYNSVLMGSTTRGLMWGNFATTGAGGPNGWLYSYQDSGWSSYNPGDTSGESDLGLFATNATGSTPEPGTFGLLLTAVGSLLFIRRRRA